VCADNIIDALKTTGGFSKEIRKRQIAGLIRYVKKLKAEHRLNEEEKSKHEEESPESEVETKDNVELGHSVQSDLQGQPIQQQESCVSGQPETKSNHCMV